MRPIDPKALKVKKRPPAGRTKSGARHLTKAVVIEPVLARDALRSLGVGEWRVAPHRSPAARLEESLGLARAINLEVRAKGLVRLPHPRPATLFGCGKIAELEGLMAQMDHYIRAGDQEHMDVPHAAFHARFVAAAGSRMRTTIASG